VGTVKLVYNIGSFHTYKRVGRTFTDRHEVAASEATGYYQETYAR
jgi:hypothetical protein